MSADVQPPPPPQQPKYSRYRSVRQAAATASRPPPPIESPPKSAETPNTAIQRSRSRYHRPSKPLASLDRSYGDSVPSIPEVSHQLTSAQIPLNGSNISVNNRAEELRLKRATLAAQEKRRQRQEQQEVSTAQPRSRVRGTTVGNGPGRSSSAQGRVLQSDETIPHQANSQGAEEEQVARILAEQKRRDLERLEAELTAAAAAPPQAERSSPSTEKVGIEKLGFLTRRRAKSKPASPRPSADTSLSKSSQEVSRTKSGEQTRNILQGSEGVVPGIDAPKSAVNAGERRVLIRWKQSSINLPITLETTPVDLIFSAANILNHVPDPSAAIILEAYTQLGLERRIRRYEHIRDTMNSWDRDTQNALIIQQSDSPNYDFDLEESAVPKEQPKDVTVYMYHSRKPGKWEKRYITLMSTGQIFISKRKDAKASDKDITTICHMTDFDIYTPTTQQIRKNIRPPKKHCYAVKSQQKPSMFLNTEKFVHFFSTDDAILAGQWYDACQQWRSWYLIHMMGEGQKKAAIKRQTLLIPDVRTASGVKARGHKIHVSVDEDPYRIGTFKPLMDLSRFETPDQDSDYNKEDENRPRQVPFHLRKSSPNPEPTSRREHYPPPVSYPRHLYPANGNEPIDSSSMDSSTFAPTSLLGRTYSQRQHLQKGREGAANDDGPFIAGPCLLNSIPTDSLRPKTGVAASAGSPLQSPHKRTPSSATRRPTTSAGTGVHRSVTQKSSISKPAAGLETSRPRAGTVTKPLVDLTPQFKEPPQWSKEGKGHGVAPPKGVPLVEVATGPQGPEMPGVPVLFRRE